MQIYHMINIIVRFLIQLLYLREVHFNAFFYIFGISSLDNCKYYTVLLLFLS